MKKEAPTPRPITNRAAFRAEESRTDKEGQVKPKDSVEEMQQQLFQVSHLSK